MEGSNPRSYSRPMRELSANGASQMRDAAQRAMSMTHSSGAAIALLDENELVTCASCGESVPPAGTRSPLSGFTGNAIRSGQTLVCDDTQADSRVDATVCRDIKVFSMAVAPIKVGTTIEGVFAIFFSSPRAATRMRVAMLRTVADVAAAILDREPAGVGKATSASASTPVAPADTVGAAAKAVLVPNSPAPAPTWAGTPAGVLKEITDDEIMDAVSQFGTDLPGGASSPHTEQSAVVSVAAEIPKRSQPDFPEKPAVRPESLIRSQQRPPAVKPVVLPAAKPETKATPKLVATAGPEHPATIKSKPEESQLLPAAADPRSAPLPQTKPPIRPARQATINETPLFQTVGGEPPRSRISLRILLPVAGVAAVVVAVAGFILYRSPGMNAKAATVAAQRTTEPPKSAPAVPQPEEASAEEEASVAPSAPPPEPPKRPERAEAPPSTRQMAESAPPKPVMVVRSGTEERVRAQEPLVEAPPTIATSATTSVVLPAPKLATPAGPAPRTVVFEPAVLLQMTKPVYPQIAVVRRVQGTVVLQIKISKEGRVVQARSIKGDAVLGQVAATAVRNWRYKPATRDGVPVDSDGEVSVNFKLPGQ